MTTQDTSLLTSLASGGLAGALFSFLANSWIGVFRRRRLHKNLVFERPEMHVNVVTVRVHNQYVLPVTDCWAYITLDFDQQEDVLPPDAGQQVHIDQGRPFPVVDERLCWSVQYPPETPNPPKVDIYGGESQSLQVLELDLVHNRICVFSETLRQTYRVFLRADRVYEGTLKIVCRETKAKEVKIRIDAKSANFPRNLILG